MKKITVAILAFFIFFGSVRADEGMWLPLLVGKQKMKEMKASGLKLKAEDLYSINNNSLKEAIVQFGGGCTGELISNEGLLITNHHCGYGEIQKHSTIEHNYLEDGFWAMSKQEELPNPGLTVKFLVRMEDVTENVLSGITEATPEPEREKLIKLHSAALIKAAVEGTHYVADVKPLFYGNQYFMYVYEVFSDVRLVGAPPSSIGKFGGDTDNWMWPRHTGDFSIFRIYANKDNKPAVYSPNNVPYKPKRFLSISIKGVKEGDFTMVYGYPGRTQQFLTSFAVKQVVEQENPAKIALRAKRLEIMAADMAADPKVRIMYSAKYASVGNSWKKWIGEAGGLKEVRGVERKEANEVQFKRWVNADAARMQAYGDVMPQFEKLYSEYSPLVKSRDYFREAVGAVEVLRLANSYGLWAAQFNNKGSFSPSDSIKLQAFGASVELFYKDYNPATDKKIFVAMLSAYLEKAPSQFIPVGLLDDYKQSTSFVETLANSIFSSSLFVDSTKAMLLWTNIDSSSAKIILNDPAYKLYNDIYIAYDKGVTADLERVERQLELAYRKYVKATMEMENDKVFYPDANSTLRIAFGKVGGFSPRDGVIYKYYTTLGGVIEKDNPDIYDYDVSEKLKTMYNTSDYGQYGNKGQLNVAFIATNHTTGGNSGSPVLNAKGELVGVNFDRAWEGTMSDILFDSSRCRNIALDIRYALFIIDKYAGATWLLNEMKIER
jgi:hypothetical protein